MIYSLTVIGCFLFFQLSITEEWISRTESLLLENDTLFLINEHGQTRLFSNVQGYLFDNNSGTLFFKKNGSVLKSSRDRAIYHQCDVQSFYRLFAIIHIIIDFCIIIFYMYRNKTSK